MHLSGPQSKVVMLSKDQFTGKCGFYRKDKATKSISILIIHIKQSTLYSLY